MHIMWPTNSGLYSSKSAYNAFFLGSVRFAPWKHIWTPDHLAKRGFPHPVACPLYDQAEENVQHILISCVLAQKAWALILHRLDLLAFAPRGMNHCFSSWWCCTIKGVLRVEREGLNTLIILVVWEIWKHRNACVFEVKA